MTTYDDSDRTGNLIAQRLPDIGWRDRHRVAGERRTRQTIELLAHRPSVVGWASKRNRVARRLDASRDLVHQNLLHRHRNV
jgi:hypothetical protein